MPKYAAAVIALAVVLAGAIAGHAVTGPAPTIIATGAAVVSPFDLMLQAEHLPVESADAI